jgi:hypothetical protein
MNGALPSPNSITLITGERGHTRQRMHTLIVQLALTGPVKLLIGGNRYNHYGVNYAIAAATPDYERILDEHITLSRAETCYQMVELLIQTETDKTPVLVMDLLTTFYDESAPDREVNHLLFEAILQLRRFSQQAAVVVSAHPRDNRPRLLKVLEKAVDRVEHSPAQPPLPTRQYSYLG